MGAKTKIIVLHMKEIIYTAFFILFLIFLAILLFFMFGRGKASETSSGADGALYSPGSYTSSISMDQANLEVEVTVDENHINSIRFSNLDESMETMYPLLSSAMEDLSEQIILSQSAENISLPEDSEYTSSLIVNAVNEALKKAAAN